MLCTLIDFLVFNTVWHSVIYYNELMNREYLNIISLISTCIFKDRFILLFYDVQMSFEASVYSVFIILFA